MSNAIYPSLVKGLAFSVTRAAEFSTIVQKSAGGAETRIVQMQNPLWHWTLQYEFLFDDSPLPFNTKPYTPYTDLRTLLGFFLARQGSADDFLFDDPDDNSVGPALDGSPIGPNPAAELQVVTDGNGNYYSPIQRDMGGLFKEDITDLNGSITVYANGVAQAPGFDYTIQGPGLAIPGYSFRGLYLAWTPTSPPTSPGTPVTAEFDFYHRVRFEEDTKDFEKWASQLWAAGGEVGTGSSPIKLVSARPV